MIFVFYLSIFILFGADEAKNLFSHKQLHQSLKNTKKVNNKVNELRAARLIGEILDFKTSNDILKQTFEKQLDQYFSNDLPWGLTSLSTLLMHVNLHDRLHEEHAIIRIKMLFTAMLPPGLDDIIVRICNGFAKKYARMDSTLKEKVLVKRSKIGLPKATGEDIELMVLVYLFVHHNRFNPDVKLVNGSDRTVVHDILSKADLTKFTPQKSTIELLHRFQKLYQRGSLMDKFH